MEITTHTARGVDKTERYGWVTKDSPGALKMLHKDVIQINYAYQREPITEKVRLITAEWSWMCLGALVVALRDGEFWVIDGQHRLMAAKRRSDISHLPCVVFETASIEEEALAFVYVNSRRKPVTSVGKHKALVTGKEDTSVFVQKQCDALGLAIKQRPSGAGHINCVAWCVKRASEDRDAFRGVLSLAAEMSQKDGIPVAEKLLEGLWMLNTRCSAGVFDKRLNKRLREKGASAMIDAANRAAAYFANGGGKIWAQGMLAELNKGLQHKFTMDGVEA